MTDIAVHEMPLRDYAFAPSAGEIVTIAGVSGIGTTDMLVDIAFALLAEGNTIDFFGLAHTEQDLKERFYQRHLGFEEVRRDVCSVRQVNEYFDSLPIQLFAEPEIDINLIEERAKHTVFISGINHLEDFSRDRGRVEELATICRRLKRLAKRLNAPLFQSAMLSQYAAERFKFRLPTKTATIKESSYIADYSDWVVHLHREESFLERERPTDDDLENMMTWQTKIAACHGTGSAFVLRRGTVRELELVYRDGKSWQPAPKRSWPVA